MKLFAQGTSLDLSHPHVMGILNVTPDSFSGDGLLALVESDDPLHPTREQAQRFL